jgi:integrase
LAGREDVGNRILANAVKAANVKRLERMPPIAHVTNHSLRRTCCSVLYEAGGPQRS